MTKRITIKYEPRAYRLWPDGTWWLMDLCKHCGQDTMFSKFCANCYEDR